MGKDCGKLHRMEHRDEVGFQINGLSHMIRWLTHQYVGEDGGHSGAGAGLSAFCMTTGTRISFSGTCSSSSPCAAPP